MEITGSRIFFATASEDPWQYAGMTSIYDQDKQYDMVAHHINCVDCGHCVDLQTPNEKDPADLTLARE